MTTILTKESNHLIFFQQLGTIITLPFPKLSSAYSYYGITGPKTSSATALPAHRAPPPLLCIHQVSTLQIWILRWLKNFEVTISIHYRYTFVQVQIFEYKLLDSLYSSDAFVLLCSAPSFPITVQYSERTCDGGWLSVTNLQKLPENVSVCKSLRFSTTRKICTINGAQTFMDLQYAIKCGRWHDCDLLCKHI